MGDVVKKGRYEIPKGDNKILEKTPIMYVGVLKLLVSIGLHFKSI